jgi:hypothetical protein
LKASIEKAAGLIHATPTGMAASPGMPLDAFTGLDAGAARMDAHFRRLVT